VAPCAPIVEMTVTSSPNPTTTERPANAIGALRLLFASLVIVSHSSEMLDGGLAREPLYRLVHTLSLGGLAVDAFFLISGYLITASFVSSASVGSYCLKRVLRIYPAFVICSLLCVLVVAPLAGAHFGGLGPGGWARLAYRLAMLKSPEVAGAFSGLPHPALNGSAWTISYEFRCYILAALFGLAGVYARPKLFAVLAAAVLAAGVVLGWHGAAATPVPGWVEAVFGDPRQDARLLGAFMTGACFWLWRRALPLKGLYAAIAAAALCGLAFSPHLAEPAFVLLGGYVLFWISFKVRWKPLLTINARNDISYGTYLYAWPIGALLIWNWRTISALDLTLLTLAGALAAGAVSWFLVERPALDRKPRGHPAPGRVNPLINIATNGGPAEGARQRA